METGRFMNEARLGDIAKLPAMELVAIIKRAEEAEAKNQQLEEALELASSMVNSYVVGPISHSENKVGIKGLSYKEFMSLVRQPTEVSIASFDLANLLKDNDNYRNLASKRFNDIKELDKKIQNLCVKLAPSFEDLGVVGAVVNVEGVLTYLNNANTDKHLTRNLSLNA